jgi:hypothetical protein
MAVSWLERHAVPLRRSVRNYEERRLETLDYALTLARQAGSRPASYTGLGLATERPLVTADGKLGGQVDAVVPTPDGVVIRDYKTGQVYEDDPKRTVKAAYQLQLQLYAVLYERTQGDWPARLELVGPKGEVVDVPFTPEECEALFEEMVRRLDDVAERVRRVRGGLLSLSELANPGEACRRCSYRPVCKAYREWSAVTPAPQLPSRVDLLGTFQGVWPVRSGLVVLELETDGSSRSVADLDPSASRNPAFGQLQSGDAVGVFDAWQNTTGSVVARDTTVVYKSNV